MRASLIAFVVVFALAILVTRRPYGIALGLVGGLLAALNTWAVERNYRRRKRDLRR